MNRNSINGHYIIVPKLAKFWQLNSNKVFNEGSFTLQSDNFEKVLNNRLKPQYSIFN